jgi:threonyl-tRNA synthetase
LRGIDPQELFDGRGVKRKGLSTRPHDQPTNDRQGQRQGQDKARLLARDRFDLDGPAHVFDFGFDDIIYKLSTRPPKRVGADETWDVAEKALADALDAKGVAWETLPGEGAFYGPKIEFSLKDSIGRVWQCGTIQVDFSMPGRLGAEYVDEDNTRKTPVMLHRAIVGSMERFIGILIENFAGALPVWLSPVQVVVMNITANQAAYAEDVLKQLQQSGLRAVGDLRNEKITYKIREHSLQKLPYQIILGDKEMAAQIVAVRTRKGEDLGQMPVSVFIERLQNEAQNFGRAA